MDYRMPADIVNQQQGHLRAAMWWALPAFGLCLFGIGIGFLGYGLGSPALRIMGFGLGAAGVLLGAVTSVRMLWLILRSGGVLLVLAGVVLWLLAIVVCWQVNDHRLTTVLLPLWRPFLALAGRGPNIGTPDAPAYEATPVHAMFAFAGIGLSVLVYIGLLWGWVAWRQRRASQSAARRTL